MINVYIEWLRQQTGYEFVEEHKFHPTRRWRFDFACLERKVAVEIDGGIWQYGRHNRAASLLKDYEKFNNAAAMGWVVLHFTPQQQFTDDAMELIRRACDVR